MNYNYTNNQLEESKIEVLLNEAKVDFSKELPEPLAALKVNGELFATLGNISLITGKAKSKKTFCVTLAMAAAVGNINTNMFSGQLPSNKNRVLLFDTEQERYQVVKVAQRVCKLANIKMPSNFDVYALRGISTALRSQLIGYKIKKTPDAGLVVIDGIRDLVTSINSEEEATYISDWLLQLTQKEKVHIMTVLHQNKTDDKARGHLGTELINKAETTVTVQRHRVDGSDISIVRPETCRHIEFSPFSFSINSEGIPVHYNAEIPQQAACRDAVKPSPEKMDKDKLYLIIEDAMKKADNKLSYKKMIEQLQESIQKVTGQEVGQKKAAAFLKHYTDNGVIKKAGTSGTKASYYQLADKKDAV